MSTADFTGPEPGTEPATPPAAPRPVEETTGLSSVEINTTAKGEVQVKVKVYAESNSPAAVHLAADNASDLYRSVRGKLHQAARSEEW